MTKDCMCIACLIDREKYNSKSYYHPYTTDLMCERQKNELDLFIEENTPLTWWQAISRTIKNYFSKPKETIEVT